MGATPKVASLALVYAAGSGVAGAARHGHPEHSASERLRWNLDRLEISYSALFFLASALVLWYSYVHASSTVLRQQLKWVTRGTTLAVLPYTILYVLPYVFGRLPGPTMKISVMSLALLPLTFGYAIFRYRLMDVDLIFKRGVVYTLAAATVIGFYFAGVAGVAELVHQRQPGTGSIGLILAVVITALLFDPVRKWIQDRVDHTFYRTRYDYRRTLLEFGRELSSQTNIEAMLSSVMDRLSRTLGVERLAIFVLTGGEHRTLRAGPIHRHGIDHRPRSGLPSNTAAATGRPLVLREYASGFRAGCGLTGDDFAS